MLKPFGMPQSRVSAWPFSHEPAPIPLGWFSPEERKQWLAAASPRLMRAQYHFRRSPKGLCAWNVHRLVELTRASTREWVPLTQIRELDEPYWKNESPDRMTCREVADHARLMLDSDLAFPVILSSDGRVMDGMHRVCKALLEGRKEIEAVRFVEDPEPDYVGRDPADLPYDD
jgi:hypothetical protein